MNRLALVAALLIAAPASAHPVPRNQYDRTVVLRLSPGARDNEVLAQLDFRLEVDAETVVLEDMKLFQKEIDLNKIHKRIDYFAEFTRLYAPIYARRFYTRLNKQELEWECVKREQTFEDEAGKPLDHLRCDFRYQATFTCAPNEWMQLTLKDLNYQEYPGKIVLTLVNEVKLYVVKARLPDAKLQELPFEKRGPDEEYALRMISLSFLRPEENVPRPLDRCDRVARYRMRLEMPQAESPQPPLEPDPPSASAPPAAPSEKTGPEERHGFSLLRLFLTSEHGLLWMLLLAAGIGAVHALTPGHGKTMVAAYLVGERGTVWHAVFLGLVTTLTHTGVVLLLAGALLFLPEHMSEDMKRNIQTGLGLAMGLAIVCLGMFLLLQRLAGRADHFHIGGGHHDHHHGHEHHHHHHHTHAKVEPAGATDAVNTTQAPAADPNRRVRWWGLVVLGATGGLVPCWDAIALLVLAVGLNLFWLALPVLLAFSAGLASVLVLIGILVVKFRNLLGRHWGEGRLMRALPIASAIVVTLMGFWVCYEVVNGSGL